MTTSRAEPTSLPRMVIERHIIASLGRKVPTKGPFCFSLRLSVGGVGCSKHRFSVHSATFAPGIRT